MTLIELVVAIGIVALLLSLILPAVQYARETCRRMHCLSNLRQIGLAMQQYQIANLVFPSAIYANSAKPDHTPVSDSNFSPFIHILPYIGEQAIFDSINFSGNGLNQENETVLNYQPSVFLCPSDGENPIPKTNDNQSFSLIVNGHNSYRVNLGPTPFHFSIAEPQARAGAFSSFSWYRPKDYTDGLSKTAFVCEKSLGDGQAGRFKISRHWVAVGGAPGVSISTTQQFVDKCAQVDTTIAPFRYTYGMSWFVTGFVHTWYNHTATPNSSLPDCSRIISGDVGFGSFQPFICTARSMHPGGVCLLLADGSTTFVSDSIDTAIWRATSTRNGGDQ